MWAPIGSAARRVLQLSWWLDDALAGQLTRTLTALAASAGGLAALLELSLGKTRLVVPACSLAASLFMALLGLVWLGQCRECRGGRSRDLARRLTTLARLTLSDLRDFPSAPKALKLFIVTRLTAGAGLIALSVAAVLNLARLSSAGVESSRLLGLSLLGGSLIGLSELARVARRAQTGQGDPEADQCRIAVQEFSAILDLGEPLVLESIFLAPTLFHRVVESLSSWRSSAGWPSADGYAEALQRHLQRCLPTSRVERQRWLGATRAEGAAALVVDGTVLIEVQRGFSPARVGDAIQQARTRALAGETKPMILAIFDAEISEVINGPATEALLSLHASSNFLATRMPATSAAPHVPFLADDTLVSATNSMPLRSLVGPAKLSRD